MNSDHKYQPFVILGTARTGSSMLWSYLNSHPEILCLRGVFGSTNKINFGKFYGELPAEYQSIKLIKYRNENPIEFLKKYIFKNYESPYKAVGFKYFYEHDRHLSDKKALIEFFIKNEQIKFIHLKRENLLESLFSYKRALLQGNWTDANPNFKTQLSIQECSNYFIRTTQNQELFDSSFGDKMFEINFDKLINETEPTLELIMKFLGVRGYELTTATKRNKEIKLSDCITNYFELKKHYKNSVYEKFFHN